MTDFWWLAVLAGACGGNVVVHVLCFRIFPKAGQYLSQLAGFVAALAFVVIAGWPVTVGHIGSWLAELCIYFCFSYSYFCLNNMGETSRRVRLAIELSRAPQGLTRDELLARYSAREIVDRRLGRLLKSGQIREQEGRYVLGNQSVLTMARIVGLFKLILNVPDATHST